MSIIPYILFRLAPWQCDRSARAMTLVLCIFQYFGFLVQYP